MYFGKTYMSFLVHTIMHNETFVASNLEIFGEYNKMTRWWEKSYLGLPIP